VELGPHGTFALHSVVALLVGTLIGIERQWTQHPAGLRTNALVALGASMFVGLSLMFEEERSPSRIAAQVVSGLGFLGGGVILREGLNVRGLNTAATIWCSGAVGSLAGAGHPIAALIGTGFVLFIHVALKPLVDWIDGHRRRSGHVETVYRLRVECAAEHERQARTVLLKHVTDEKRMNLHSLASTPINPARVAVTAEAAMSHRDDRAVEEMVARVSVEPEFESVRWDRG
jgi:putative Mg2+ transporter-C (MgtC) family protein